MPIITTLADFGEVADIGSDFAYGKVVTSLAGAGSDTFGALPIRESFDASPTVGTSKKTSEGGTDTVTGTTEAWILKYITQQVGKLVIYDLPKAIAGKYVLTILELIQLSNAINGKCLYGIFLGKMIQKPGLKNKVSPEFQFQLYKPTADIAIALGASTDPFPNFTSAKADRITAGNISLLKGEYYGIAEVTNT